MRAWSLLDRLTIARHCFLQQETMASIGQAIKKRPSARPS